MDQPHKVFASIGIDTRMEFSIERKRVHQNHNKEPSLVNNVVEKPRFDMLGFDISYFEREHQYLVCLCGLFSFSLCYGYLQELLSVHLFSRKMTLFLSTVQFAGYTGFCYLIRHLSNAEMNGKPTSSVDRTRPVPPQKYIALALMRALELGLTNLSLVYLNFPAKTLLKSSRVVFTMVIGCWLQQKTYSTLDFSTIGLMISGLCVFLRADATSDTIVFNPIGVLLLVLSLLCDGAIINTSEGIMKEYNVPQDEFIFQVYSLATCVVTIAAASTGELDVGVLWMSTPGTYQDFLAENPVAQWTVPGKLTVVILFGFSGYMALYFSQTLVKHFGALTMSITSTTRRATTMFLSFVLFDNVLTSSHLFGISMFAIGLTGKVFLQFSKGDRFSRMLKRKISGTPSSRPYVSSDSRPIDLESPEVGRLVQRDSQVERATEKPIHS